jgi:hypothetical protein
MPCAPQFVGPKRVVAPAINGSEPQLALDFVLLSHNREAWWRSKIGRGGVCAVPSCACDVLRHACRAHPRGAWQTTTTWTATACERSTSASERYAMRRRLAATNTGSLGPAERLPRPGCSSPARAAHRSHAWHATCLLHISTCPGAHVVRAVGPGGLVRERGPAGAAGGALGAVVAADRQGFAPHAHTLHLEHAAGADTRTSACTCRGRHFPWFFSLLPLPPSACRWWSWTGGRAHNTWQRTGGGAAGLAGQSRGRGTAGARAVGEPRGLCSAAHALAGVRS